MESVGLRQHHHQPNIFFFKTKIEVFKYNQTDTLVRNSTGSGIYQDLRPLKSRFIYELDSVF